MAPRNLEWINNSKDREEFERKYDEWAETYDDDLVDSYDYTIPEVICRLLMAYVTERDACILDAGAGTGLAGQYLARYGYQNLFALDMSQGMLDRAAKKGIYRKLNRMVLGERLDYPDNWFNAVVSVGTIGHAPPESFDELIRITKPAGYIVFSLRDESYHDPRFADKLRALEVENKCKLIEHGEPFLGLPGGYSDVYWHGFVYQVL